MIGFSFNGKHSSEFKIACKSINRTLKPKLGFHSVKIMERHGAIVEPSSYELREIKVRIYLIEKRLQDIREKSRELAYWLSKYGKLVFDDEKDKYYRGAVYDQIDIEQLATTGECDLNFVCQPFAVGKIHSVPLNLGHNRTLPYKGTIPAPTRIILKNQSESEVINVKLISIQRRGN